LDIAQFCGDNNRLQDTGLLNQRLPNRKDDAMGDKGGKKDKQKSSKQKANKQEQAAKGKQAKSRPK
jgi:hypothetical protein